MSDDSGILCIVCPVCCVMMLLRQAVLIDFCCQNPRRSTCPLPLQVSPELREELSMHGMRPGFAERSASPEVPAAESDGPEERGPVCCSAM